MDNIYVMYGDNPEEMVQAILQKMQVAADLAAIAKENPLIGIKPNLVVPQPAEWGATTAPQLVQGVIKYLKNHGFADILILESSWIGDSTVQAFQVCGYEEISSEFQVPLIDLKKDAACQVDVAGLKLNICRQALAVDYLINMPVLKAHSQTKLTCALKNLKGCIPDQEKRRFHTLGLHQPIAYLNKALKAHLTVVDGIIGDLTFEEGGAPVRMNRVIAGRDPVLIDAYAAELIGYHSDDVPYIGLAAGLGVGSNDLGEEKIIELNSKREAGVPEPSLESNEVDYLKSWIRADQACSACFGSLIHGLMRLKEKGKLSKLAEKVYLGQGYQGKKLNKLGIGLCTNKFTDYLAGCPPKAKEIVAFLEKKIDDGGGAIE